MGGSRLNLVALLRRSGWRFRIAFIVAGFGFLTVAAYFGAQVWANYQFGAARTALEQGDGVDARVHIRRCLSVWPADADVHFLAARIERRLGEYRIAEDHLQSFKRVRGITDEYQTEWILLRAQGGELPQLELSLWNCVEKNHPQSQEILETLAAGFLREGRFSAAAVCLHEWVKREPDNVLALEWRGVTRQQLQRRDEALQDYRKVLKLAPHRWRTRLQLAQLLMEMTQFSEAARELTVLNAAHGDEGLVQLAWGQCLLNQGRNEEARAILLKLSASRDRQPQAFHYLGKLESDPIAAADWYRKALAVQPGNTEAHFALYTSLQQAGLVKEAAKQLQVYQRARQDQTQTKKLRDLMEKNPNNPEYLSKLGVHLLDKFDNPQGIYLLQRALVFEPNYTFAHEALARYFEKKNLPDQAAKHRQFSAAPKK